jgi:hypothetical protein
MLDIDELIENIYQFIMLQENTPTILMKYLMNKIIYWVFWEYP